MSIGFSSYSSRENRDIIEAVNFYKTPEGYYTINHLMRNFMLDDLDDKMRFRQVEFPERQASRKYWQSAPNYSIGFIKHKIRQLCQAFKRNYLTSDKLPLYRGFHNISIDLSTDSLMQSTFTSTSTDMMVALYFATSSECVVESNRDNCHYLLKIVEVENKINYYEYDNDVEREILLEPNIKFMIKAEIPIEEYVHEGKKVIVLTCSVAKMTRTEIRNYEQTVKIPGTFRKHDLALYDQSYLARIEQITSDYIEDQVELSQDMQGVRELLKKIACEYKTREGFLEAKEVSLMELEMFLSTVDEQDKSNLLSYGEQIYDSISCQSWK